MRSVIFCLGITFAEILNEHWGMSWKINPFEMIGLTAFFIYLCILDWVAVYWNSRLHNWREA